MKIADFIKPAEPGELGMLFSFHYYSERDLSGWVDRSPYKPSILIDSGGFSAFTQGASIDLNAYASWLRRHGRVITHYANLDVIGDPKGTLTNQLRMESLGLRPLPISHYGSDPSGIAAYAKHGHAYQCLGGMVPHLRGVAQAMKAGRDHPLLSWLDRCFEVAAEHGVLFHGFGATTWPLLLRYPWRSVDSSSWTGGYRYGQCQVFDFRRGRWAKVKSSDRDSVMGIADLIRMYGANPVSIIKDDRSSRTNIIKVSARSYLAAQRYLQSRGKIERIYLADSYDADRACDAVMPKLPMVKECVQHLEGAARALGGIE
jgi:hypothetical protein